MRNLASTATSRFWRLLSMSTAIPPTVLLEILASKSSHETIVSLLNEMEAKHSSLPRHFNAKRVYPFWKACLHCNKPFMTLNRTQALRNKTCGPACTAAMIGQANATLMPLEKRKGREISCVVCGALVWKPAAWLRRVSAPTCSRTCNGSLRGAEWKEHAAKGRAAWSPASEKANTLRMTGATNPAWKGGVTLRNRKGAYADQAIKYVRCPPAFLSMARADGYVMEHRLIAAQHMARPLTRAEVVHHINHDATDNRPQNLMVFATNAIHKAFEHGVVTQALWCGLSLFITEVRSGASGCQQVHLLPLGTE
ncbi:HNH endonuclease [Azotobacter vinelandii]|uniref:HNH endonuclease n=1 Tax=Azotobacter vinelandii TaxID=354 RepID=UPI00345C7494